MKKLKKTAYIFVIIIIIGLSFFVYSSIAKESTPDVRDKTFSEIQYFETKITYIFNSLNNIKFENYKISVEDISEKSKKSSESSSGAGSGSNQESEQSSSGSGGSESSGGSGSSGSSGGSGSEGSSEEQSSSSNSGENSLDETKKYTLNMNGVLSTKEEINWEYIKNEAEMLQDSISTMTLDLYEISLNNTDILNFNKDYDNLLVAIKNEDKENSLKNLTSIYSYIPKFIKNCNKNDTYEIVVNTKLEIFNAYSILDKEDWDSMNKSIQSANETFSRLLTDANIKNNNQYTINKCYINLNSLQSSIEKHDKEIFLIKYKNILEDLNNL